eukprot:m.260109 g.260109  ORF g.260109 m.260109 type:complete len:417 (+) comp39228_c0_seq1:100-1350(+)
MMFFAMSMTAVTMVATAHGEPSTTTSSISNLNSALYYKLDGDDLKAKDWPTRFAKYSVLVTDPGMSSAELAQIRQDLPNRSLLAYTCMGWAYVKQPCTNCTGPKCSGCPGARCVDRLDTHGQPYWNDSFNVQNLHDGKAICPFGGFDSTVTPVAAWIPHKDSVDAMVRFHTEVTLPGYDGLYIDDFFTSYYAAWQTYIELISAPPDRMEICRHEPVHGTTSRPEGCESFYSIDSSQTNSSLDALQAQYAAWRPYYTASLRKAVGPKGILIANANTPAMADPSLNGITVEFEHCAGDQDPHVANLNPNEGDNDTATKVVGTTRTSASSGPPPPPTLNDVCLQTFLGQKALTDMSGLQPVFALWLTHSEVVPAKTQCAELAQIRAQLPWIREGDDITDCTRETGAASCVHCDNVTFSL